MTRTLKRSTMAKAVSCLCWAHSGLWAQTTLEEINVRATPQRSGDLATPRSQYSGSGLVLRSESSIGETLNGTPGVSSTYFGPQASRPIIRGLDGDRVRILNNSGASLDVSALSYDHAVAIDPIIAERIEVLRGSSTLLYGGNAIGGVVNIVDGRIPKSPISAFQGRVDLGLSSAERGRNAAFVLETGNGRYALHADVHARKNDDVSVPKALPCDRPGSNGLARRLCNSAASTDGGALGGSLFFDQGYFGLSASHFSSNYGSVAEDEVSIAMRSSRLALDGQIKFDGFLQSLKLQYGRSDYQHTELDAGVPATVFKNTGFDFRLEARHRTLGRFDGLLGLQIDSAQFSAVGDEVFSPTSRTKSTALFLFEEASFKWGKINFGGRIESVEVASFPVSGVARFVGAERSFNPSSWAVGGTYNVNANWGLNANLSFNQRAPKDYELFANGPHLATAAYETGSSSLSKERSSNVDLGLTWRGKPSASGQRSPNQAAFNVFLNRFQNYLSLEATGQTRSSAGALNPSDLDGDGLDDATGSKLLPEFAYRQHGARLQGFELNGTWRLMQGSGNPQSLDLQWRADYVKGINTDTQALLPRIAPLRLGATLIWAQGRQEGWGARLGADYFARPADGQSAPYTLLNGALTYQTQGKWGGQSTRLLWYARLNNITDRLAYSATSVLTQSLPGRVPLPGRSLRIGVQAVF
jgi:iron complex outermembrane recepter protein